MLFEEVANNKNISVAFLNLLSVSASVIQQTLVEGALHTQPGLQEHEGDSGPSTCLGASVTSG